MKSGSVRLVEVSKGEIPLRITTDASVYIVLVLSATEETPPARHLLDTFATSAGTIKMVSNT